MVVVSVMLFGSFDELLSATNSVTAQKTDCFNAPPDRKRVFSQQVTSFRPVTVEELTRRLGRSGHLDEIEGQLAKLGFAPEFVAHNVFSGSDRVTVSHIAMLWQGMPNKHDRKRTRALFEALSTVGLLAPTGDDETWSVLSGT